MLNSHRIAGVVAAAGITGAASADTLVYFVFDQILDAIIRIEDRNNDGDTLDPGEVVRFFDENVPVTGIENAQGIVAVSPWEVYATDNFEPDNIIRLIDLNQDGDALDPGESSVWFDGVLPSGQTMTNPADLEPGFEAGVWFLVDNNTLDETRPEAIYRLEDLNADDDVNDLGEVTLFRELEPIGSCCDVATFDVEQDENGDVFYINSDFTLPNGAELIRLSSDGSSANLFVDSFTLFQLSGYFLDDFAPKFLINRDTNELYVPGYPLGTSSASWLALKDRNGNGAIDQLNEVHLLWDENLHGDDFSTGAIKDGVRTPDGRLVWPDALQDRLWQLTDINTDGDFLAGGETTYIYDADEAAAHGQESATLMLSLTVALNPDISCPADLAGDGQVNVFDLLDLLSLWGPCGDPTPGNCPADLTGDGQVNVFDLLDLLGAWGPC